MKPDGGADTAEQESVFWKSVRELAEMRKRARSAKHTLDLEPFRVPGKMVARDHDYVFYWMWNQDWPGWESAEWIEVVWS